MVNLAYQNAEVDINLVKAGVDAIRVGLFVTGSYDIATSELNMKIDTEDQFEISQIDIVVSDNYGTYREMIRGPIVQLESAVVSHSYSIEDEDSVYSIEIESVGQWISILMSGNTTLSANSELIHYVVSDNEVAIQGNEYFLIKANGEWAYTANIYLYSGVHSIDILASYIKYLGTDAQNTAFNIVINKLIG